MLSTAGIFMERDYELSHDRDTRVEGTGLRQKFELPALVDGHQSPKRGNPPVIKHGNGIWTIYRYF